MSTTVTSSPARGDAPAAAAHERSAATAAAAVSAPGARELQSALANAPMFANQPRQRQYFKTLLKAALMSAGYWELAHGKEPASELTARRAQCLYGALLARCDERMQKRILHRSAIAEGDGPALASYIFQLCEPSSANQMAKEAKNITNRDQISDPPGPRPTDVVNEMVADNAALPQGFPPGILMVYLLSVLPPCLSGFKVASQKDNSDDVDLFVDQLYDAEEDFDWDGEGNKKATKSALQATMEAVCQLCGQAGHEAKECEQLRFVIKKFCANHNAYGSHTTSQCSGIGKGRGRGKGKGKGAASRADEAESGTMAANFNDIMGCNSRAASAFEVPSNVVPCTAFDGPGPTFDFTPEPLPPMDIEIAVSEMGAPSNAFPIIPARADDLNLDYEAPGTPIITRRWSQLSIGEQQQLDIDVLDGTYKPNKFE